MADLEWIPIEQYVELERGERVLIRLKTKTIYCAWFHGIGPHYQHIFKLVGGAKVVAKYFCRFTEKVPPEPELEVPRFDPSKKA